MPDIDIAMNSNSNNIPWTFHRHINAIVHPKNQCEACKNFISHAITALEEPDNPSWQKALAAQQAHCQPSALVTLPTDNWQHKFQELQTTHDELNNKYCNIKTKYNMLYEEFQTQKRELIQYEDRVQELSVRLREKNDEEGNSGHNPKRRRIAHDPHGDSPSDTTDRSDSSASTDLGPTIIHSSLPKQIQPHYPSTHNPDDHKFRTRVSVPTTISQCEEYFRILIDSQMPNRKPAFSVYYMLRDAKQKAKITAENERSEIDRLILSKFFIPPYISDHAHNPHSPNTPTPDTNVESTANWIIGNPTKPLRKLLGVFIRYDHGVLLRSIRGRITLLGREPNLHKPTPPQERNRYMCAAVELTLTPNYYADFLCTNNLQPTEPIPPSSKYSSEPRNISIDDVALFFMNQGITVHTLADAGLYAFLWVMTYHSMNPEIQLAISALRDKVLPHLINIGIPAGYDDDFYMPNKIISRHPSTALTGLNLFTKYNITMPTLAPAPTTPGMDTSDYPPVPSSADHTIDSTVDNDTPSESTIVDPMVVTDH